MEPVTFSARSSQKLIAILIGIPVMVTALLAASYFTWDALTLLSPADGRGQARAAIAIAMAVLAIAVVPVSAVRTVLAAKYSGPECNFLQVGRTGLNYMRHGKARLWAWNELSGFNIVSKYRYIEFVLPETAAMAAKRDPWVHEVTPDGPIAVVRDIYDTPLEEIAETLNAYRDRALGGGDQST